MGQDSKRKHFGRRLRHFFRGDEADEPVKLSTNPTQTDATGNQRHHVDSVLPSHSGSSTNQAKPSASPNATGLTPAPTPAPTPPGPTTFEPTPPRPTTPNPTLLGSTPPRPTLLGPTPSGPTPGPTPPGPTPPGPTSPGPILAEPPTQAPTSDLYKHDVSSCSDGSTGQRLWAQAYQTIEEDGEFLPLLEAYRELINGEDAASACAHTDNVGGRNELTSIQRVAQQKLEKLDSSRLTTSICGKRIAVRENVRKLVKVVTSFSSFIGTAVSTEPHAALAWAGVLIILPLLDNIFQQDEDAATGFEKISFLLIRFGHLEEELLPLNSSHSTRSSHSDALVRQVERKMVQVYSVAYQYQIRMVLQFSRRKPHQIVRNIVAADDWKAMLQGIETSDMEIGDAIRDLAFGHLSRKFEDVERLIEERIKGIRDLQETTLETVKDLRGFELLSKLPYASDAVFDSEAVSQQGKCLQGTQAKVLAAIQNWAEDSDSSLIFWLHGMAGTGKSSIALTVAEALNDGVSLDPRVQLATHTHLGASFFLRHDDPTRNTTASMLATIARAMAERIPALGEHIIEAISADGNIGTKRLQQQMAALIEKPLSDFTERVLFPIHLVIIIDALDEGKSLAEIDQFLGLLSKLQHLRRVGLRILVTSRPESHISNALPMSLVRSLALGKIPLPMRKDKDPDDITMFMTHELGRITRARRLGDDWITESEMGQVIEKADGLFIYAATTCRFFDVSIGDRVRQMRLRKVIEGNTGSGTPEDRLAEIYLKVLSFPTMELLDDEKEETYSVYRRILGAMTLVSEPVSVATLSQLIEMSGDSLEREVEQLHSIISISMNSNKRSTLSFFHLSFQNYLLSEKCEPSFQINQAETQWTLFTRCLAVMNAELDQDMCRLRLPGTLVSHIPRKRIRRHISQHLRYSCLYWTDHLSKLDLEHRKLAGLVDEGAVHKFLGDKFLYWLEALSLLGELPKSIAILEQLQSLTPTEAPQLSRLLQDFRRFTLSNRHGIEQAPLQTYCVLIFSPMKSLVRPTFSHLIPSWITETPVVGEHWDSELLILEGHQVDVTCIAASPDGTMVASGSTDRTTRIWDATTGAEMLRFKAPAAVKAVAFSADCKSLASASKNGWTCVLDLASGEVSVLEPFRPRRHPGHFGFSDRLVLGYGSGLQHIPVDSWDLGTGKHAVIQLERDSKLLTVSPDAKYGVLREKRRLRIFHLHEAKVEKDFPGVTADVASFSADGQKLVTIERGGRFVIWDATDCWKKIADFTDSAMLARWVALSTTDGLTVVAPDLSMNMIRIFRIDAGTMVPTISKDIHIPSVTSVAFLSNGKTLAVISLGMDKIRLIDLSTDTDENGLEPDISSIWARPGDERTFLTYSYTGSKVWLHDTGIQKAQEAQRVAISPDRSFVGLVTPTGVDLCDFSLTKVASLGGASDIVFSKDGGHAVLVASNEPSGRGPAPIRLVNTRTLEERFEGKPAENASIRQVHFPPGNNCLVWLAPPTTDRATFTFCIYSLQTSSIVAQIAPHYQMWDFNDLLRFSPDGGFIAMCQTDSNLQGEECMWAVILRASTGVEVCRLGPLSGISDMAFDATGHRIAVAWFDVGPATITIWDTLTGNKSLVIDPGAMNTKLTYGGLEFSPTDQIKVLGTAPMVYPCQVLRWDSHTGEKKGDSRFNFQLREQNVISFSPDGTHLVHNVNGGRLPLAPQRGDSSVDVDVPEEALDCLYISTEWLVQGYGGLVWLPPAYRVDPSATNICGGTVTIGGKGRIFSVGFDLKNTPLARRDIGFA